ncbi:hypothetical protein [Teredinibacter turnerae]|uniref:hypothetical protein n=1 Tax=Teredinibacter turnerae TaxID=2426 RepID=UPI00041E559F|nr:hypothetical protein [Teredinibacter turnerae]
MLISNLYLIAAAELAALLIGVCVFLLVQNRSLSKLVKRLRERLAELIDDLRHAHAHSKAAEESAADGTYIKHLDRHIALTKKHHKSLEPGPEIVLDVDPDAPSPRRVAALRYLLLLAEKEACATEKTNWKVLERKYEQLLAFNTTYGSSSGAESDTSEIDTLREELVAAKKRINNLERFRALYFDLEEKWESSRDTAEQQFNELAELTAELEGTSGAEALLKGYQNNYLELGRLIENGVDGASLMGERHSENNASEVSHLRAVAADQHRIINELQRKLQEAKTVEQTQQLVNDLQDQLQKQIRFVQESETCIQLLEDELNTANKENDQLKSRLSQVPNLKLQMKELRDKNNDYEVKLHTLQVDNHRLSAKKAPAAEANDDEVKRLKKEISDLETKYAELEEKFLDLKI